MDLKDTEIDFFKELATIGSGNAATSLSKILKHSIHLSVPQISLLDYSEIFSRIGSPDKKVIATLANINNPTGGIMMLILDLESTNYILNSLGLTKVEDSDIVLKKLEESALTEIGNILFNSYLCALSKMIGKTIVPNRPCSQFDMLGAILNYPISVMPDAIDQIMFMDSEFKLDNKKINAKLLLITDFTNLREYMKVFGI